jgi:hypothetical protein
MFGELTLDVIQRVALGREKTILNTDEKDPIYDLIRNFFNPPRLTENRIATFFGGGNFPDGDFTRRHNLTFPAGTYDFLPLTKHLYAMIFKGASDLFPSIRQRIEGIVAKRKEMLAAGRSSAATDFIELFLDAEADDEHLKKLAGEFDASRQINRQKLKFERKMDMNV